MKVLLTGGAGFIGSNLTRSLLDRGDHVVCLDNFNTYYDPAIKRENIADYLPNTNYTLVNGDIRDFDLLTKVFDDGDFDIVVHLAARAGVRPSLVDPMLYQDVNLKGTVNLLEHAKQHKIPKFVFASSSSVYGKNEKVPFSEDDFVDHPVSPYAATKRAGEVLAYTYHHLYDMSISCLRFFTVYGPRQRPDMAIHKFTDLIYHKEPIQMFGDGSSQRDYTFVSDIVHGIIQSMDRCDGYNIYNLGESNTISLKELIGLIEDSIDTKAIIEQKPLQPGDVPITYADVTKARKELNYDPQVNIEEGIKRFAVWYLNRKQNKV